MMFFAGLAIYVARTFVDAWGLFVLWGWFVQPLGAPAITYVHAIGLDWTIGFVIACITPKTPSIPTDEVFAHSAGKLVLAPIAVAVGWLIQAAMA